MSTDLTRRPGVASTRREERRLALSLREAQVPAQVAAAKMEAASFAAHVALHHAGMLSAAEARVLQQAPLGAGRYKAIVDAYAGYCCHELALLAHQ